MLLEQDKEQPGMFVACAKSDPPHEPTSPSLDSHTQSTSHVARSRVNPSSMLETIPRCPQPGAAMPTGGNTSLEY